MPTASDLEGLEGLEGMVHGVAPRLPRPRIAALAPAGDQVSDQAVSDVLRTDRRRSATRSSAADDPTFAGTGG